MAMSNSSRADILSAVRNNLPQEKVEHPTDSGFQRPPDVGAALVHGAPGARSLKVLFLLRIKQL
jgi:hypothetical protein